MTDKYEGNRIVRMVYDKMLEGPEYRTKRALVLSLHLMENDVGHAIARLSACNFLRWNTQLNRWTLYAPNRGDVIKLFPLDDETRLPPPERTYTRDEVSKNLCELCRLGVREHDDNETIWHVVDDNFICCQAERWKRRTQEPKGGTI